MQIIRLLEYVTRCVFRYSHKQCILELGNCTFIKSYSDALLVKAIKLGLVCSVKID